MNIDRFWEVVDLARSNGGNESEARVEALQTLLNGESLEELQSFQDHYDQMIMKSYTWDLWGAAYVMNGGCSDDGFRYFQDWLISEGRKVFEKAIDEADSLADVAVDDYAENELFGYVALEVFNQKGGGEIEREFSTEIGSPGGEEWDEEELPDRYPLLSKKYGFS